MGNESYLFFLFALISVCNGAYTTIPIERATARFKFDDFDDWQLYNKHAGTFQHPLSHHDQSTFYHTLYTASIAIGTPPQHFTANIDLGWSDMFVPSVKCLQDPATARNCRLHNKYNQSSSTTYHTSEIVTEIVYESLGTSGHLSQDILRVGGLDILDQQFEEATFWRSMYFYWAPLDSALGLSRLQTRTPASNASTKSALRNMIDQRVLSCPVFSLRLPRRDHESGELTLGYFPPEVLEQSAVQLPIIEANPPDELYPISYFFSSGYTVELESITLQSSHGNNLSSKEPPTYKAGFSNSHDYISLPDTLFKDIQSNLHPNLGMDDWLADLDCSMRDELPNVVFSFSKNAVIVLTPWHYLTEVRDPEKGMRCVLPFYSLQADDGDSEWVVLGSAFMQGLHSAFDVENSQIALAVLEK